MADRSSEVFCDGCGDSTGYLPHIPYENNSHDRPVFCIEKCAPYVRKGIKTSEMANFEWVSVLENIVSRRYDNGSIGDYRRKYIDDFGNVQQVGDLEHQTLKSFFETMAYSPEHMPQDQFYEPEKVERMTVEEWSDISMMKFEGYKQIVAESDCPEELDLEFLEKYLSKKDPYKKKKSLYVSVVLPSSSKLKDPIKIEHNLLKRKRLLELRKKS